MSLDSATPSQCSGREHWLGVAFAIGSVRNDVNGTPICAKWSRYDGSRIWPSSIVMKMTRSVVSTRLTCGAKPFVTAIGVTTVGGGARRSFGGAVVVVEIEIEVEVEVEL